MLNKELYKKLLYCCTEQDANEVLNCLACLCSHVSGTCKLDKEHFKALFIEHVDQNWEFVAEVFKDIHDSNST